MAIVNSYVSLPEGNGYNHGEVPYKLQYGATIILNIEPLQAGIATQVIGRTVGKSGTTCSISST